MQERLGGPPRTALILGSGAGSVIDRVDSPRPPLSLPEVGLPSPSVKGHSGRIVVGQLGAERVAVLAGRIHYYEGRPTDEWLCAIRALAVWGVKRLVLTSAVGGIRPSLVPGSLVRITDHINLTGANPLIGPNDDSLGPRFPDLSRAYDPDLGQVFDRIAVDMGISLERGVYVTCSGPSYETPAEIRFLSMIGGDVVGMTISPEVICAVHAGLRVVAIGVVSNLASGLTDEEATHADVVEVVKAGSSRLHALLEGVMERW